MVTYISWTNDLKDRFIRHNKGLVKATRDRAPLKLIYYEACTSRGSAIVREKQLKSGFGRAYLRRIGLK